MSHDTDASKIVKEFMDLWLKEFSSQSKNPEMVSSTISLFEQLQKNYHTLYSATKHPQQHDASSSDSSLSDHVNLEHNQLTQRIIELERRVAELESKLEGKS